PADATHRAVNDETFSSWSAQTISAARKSFAACDTRGAQCRRSVSSTVFAAFGDSTAALVNKLRIRHPVWATERGRRSNASRSRVATSGSVDLALAIKDPPSGHLTAAKWWPPEEK